MYLQACSGWLRLAMKPWGASVGASAGDAKAVHRQRGAGTADSDGSHQAISGVEDGGSSDSAKWIQRARAGR